MKSKRDIVILSHLRWNSVFQRPHHITIRLARDRKVLFVEEPVEPDSDKQEGEGLINDININLSVLTPVLEKQSWEENIAVYKKLIREILRKDNYNDPVFWFYSPHFHGLIDLMEPELIVYDCMDELSAFKNASAHLPQYEKKVIGNASIVFTGGKSIFESKQKLHNNVHCFPSSVDSHHFARAYDSNTYIPADIASLPQPIVGFYGVIDERIDLDLLERTAARNPNISFVMIGPVVKISKSDLPIRSNIHYLGSRSYHDLPNYLRAFDIAMMPFAINEATKYISPTKTLEFMAAKKPIISTPVFDVVRDYSEVVYIVNNEDEFTKAIKYYLEEPLEAQLAREQRKAHIISATSWDSTVESMEKLIKEAEKSNVKA